MKLKIHKLSSPRKEYKDSFIATMGERNALPLAILPMHGFSIEAVVPAIKVNARYLETYGVDVRTLCEVYRKSMGNKLSLYHQRAEEEGYDLDSRLHDLHDMNTLWKVLQGRRKRVDKKVFRLACNFFRLSLKDTTRLT